MNLRSNLSKLKDTDLECLRCTTRMKEAGLMQLHEGTNWGALGPAGELMVGRLEVDTYVCPNCGKIEFFF